MEAPSESQDVQFSWLHIPHADLSVKENAVNIAISVFHLNLCIRPYWSGANANANAKSREDFDPVC